MHNLNTLIYTEQSLSKYEQIIKEENDSNFQRSMIKEEDQFNDNSLTLENVRSTNKTVRNTSQYDLESRRNNAYINQATTIDELMKCFNQNTSTNKINSIMSCAKNKQADEVVQHILKHYCEEENYDDSQIKEAKQHKLSNFFKDFQQKYIKNTLSFTDESVQQNRGHQSDHTLISASHNPTFIFKSQIPGSYPQPKIQFQTDNIMGESNPLSQHFNNQQNSVEALSSMRMSSSISKKAQTQNEYIQMHSNRGFITSNYKNELNLYQSKIISGNIKGESHNFSCQNNE